MNNEWSTRPDWEDIAATRHAEQTAQDMSSMVAATPRRRRHDSLARADQLIQRQLAPMRGQGWAIHHQLTIAGGIVDHLALRANVIVCIVDAVLRGRVEVDQQQIRMNGSPVPHLPRATGEVERVHDALSAALGRPIQVTGVVAVHDADRMTVHRQPPTTTVLAAHKVGGWLRHLPSTRGGDNASDESERADVNGMDDAREVIVYVDGLVDRATVRQDRSGRQPLRPSAPHGTKVFTSAGIAVHVKHERGPDKARLVVRDLTGLRLGYVDLRTDEVHAAPENRGLVQEASLTWLRS